MEIEPGRLCCVSLTSEFVIIFFFYSDANGKYVHVRYKTGLSVLTNNILSIISVIEIKGTDCHKRNIKFVAFNLIIIKLTLIFPTHRKTMWICVKVYWQSVRFMEVVCTQINNLYYPLYF